MALGSVVMPFNPPVPADADYWHGDSIPHAGKILAEYEWPRRSGTSVYWLTPEQRKENSTMQEQRAGTYSYDDGTPTSVRPELG